MEKVYCANCGRVEDFHKENCVLVEGKDKESKILFFCRERCKEGYKKKKWADEHPMNIGSQQ